MLALELFINGLVTGSALGVVAISFALIYSTTSIFHIAHAGVYTLGAYIAWSLASRDVPIVLATIAAMVVCAAVGVVIQTQIYERLARRKASPFTILVASLGVLAVLQAIIVLIYTQGVLTLPPSAVISIHGVRLTTTQIVTVAVAFAAYLLILLLLARTDFGRRLRAVASNPALASITGLSPRVVYVQIFALASALAVLASVLVSRDFGIQPYTGIHVLLTATVAMIAGGMGSMTGAFLMAIVISVLQNEFLLIVPGDWGVACTFSVFLIFMLFRPQGLFSAGVRA
jgi:branched-chain amino acid transport system permease protein